MPSKKRKYNARFPAGRIKKIMQTDEEVGKVAQAVPVIISRTLELFVESLLNKALQITTAKNAKTLSPSHMKQCILSESRFDFLKDLVKNIPDINNEDPETPTTSSDYPPLQIPPLAEISDSPANNVQIQASYSANFYAEQRDSKESVAPVFHISTNETKEIPPLIPIRQQSTENPVFYCQSNDNLCIDEDYDN